MRLPRTLAAAACLAIGAAGAGSGPAHAAAGCVTLASPSLTLCSFTADAGTGGVHADTVWSLTDTTSGVLTAFGGAYDPVAEPSAFFAPVTLTPGHTYTLQLNAPGAGIAESGL
jgi:hypothetical protein